MQDKINFARHLSIVIKAGLPILEGLRMIRKQTASKNLLRVIDSIMVDVANGQFLAASMGKFPGVFDGFFVSIVEVGERSGTLAANLLYVAEEMKKARDLKNKVRSAMVYPAVIMLATLVLTSFLLFFVFPKILPIFASLRVQLPLTTKILIVVAEFLIANGLWVALGLVGFFITVRLLLSVYAIRFLVHRILFSVPIFGQLSIEINMANFSRVLSVLLRGGIKIVEALDITAQTFDNLVYRKEIVMAAEEIRKGNQLAKYLADRHRIFPVLLSGLIGIGENTGNLEDNLLYLSDYYREEAEMSVKNLTTLIEPMTLLFMGLVVGFVAVSIITPIYQISQGVGR